MTQRCYWLIEKPTCLLEKELMGDIFVCSKKLKLIMNRESLISPILEALNRQRVALFMSLIKKS